MTRQKAGQYDGKVSLRGWEALEVMLKERGLFVAEIQEARKSFYEGIEVLSKMFMLCEHNIHDLRTCIDSSPHVGPQNDSGGNDEASK
ncbi:MAG: hypothetical protein JW800_02180 [Candidatus Omnitrophica bacterium]|nr:hypothetical protein [Candidatus Omnitrophota bacterium]